MNKLADYFIICGLDIDSGLEPDKYAGILESIPLLSFVHYNVFHLQKIICMYLRWKEHIKIKYWRTILKMYHRIHLTHQLLVW